MEQNISALPNQPQQVAEEKQKREYTGAESVFAWLAMLAGYALFRTIPITENSFGALLYVVAMFALTTAFVIKRGAKLGVMPVCAMVMAIAVSLSLFFSSNSFVHFFAWCFAIASY